MKRKMIMNETDWLQTALAKYNVGKAGWYGWRKVDDDGNKIPNDQRMKYEHIILNDNTAILPSEAEVNAKIQELKNREDQIEINQASAKSKLEALGLSVDEIQDTFNL
jgi:hypothetical protein|tara:strand:+ start:116 stop:439 length:324 start_codon:yes stop_codon:yes gene_type:complete